MTPTATIIADSISAVGKRITTYELEYPRFIHSEFLTHRMISKNAASSRAIPIETTIQQVIDNPAMPVYWGKNQRGMSAKEELTPGEIWEAKRVWLETRDQVIEGVRLLQSIGLHKQISNRCLEPWLHIKVVATATEWDNFFHLRRHPDAQPEIHALADAMWDARQASTPRELEYTQWHLPYVTDTGLSPEVALKLSASLCAQVSFRKADDSVEKALAIYDRLVTSTPVHASPFEHQAQPMIVGHAYSGNFFGWRQHRSLIRNHTCNNYKPN